MSDPQAAVALVRDRRSDYRDQSTDPVLSETLLRYELHLLHLAFRIHLSPVFAAFAEALDGWATSLRSLYETALVAPERRRRMRRMYGARRGHRPR